MSSQNSQSDEEYWLFGYGSLIWKPPPHYDRRIPGYIKSYVRRFWQARLDTRPLCGCSTNPYYNILFEEHKADRHLSEDHRGTPEAPGRVVTLIEKSVWEGMNDHHEADDVVWGVAYRIEQSKIEEVKEYLDIREINGYSIHTVDVHKGDPTAPPIKAIVYIGTPDNPQFIKDVPKVEDLGRNIFDSRGPSGENSEYLLHLHNAILELHPGSKDNHVAELSEIVKLLMAAEKNDKSQLAEPNMADPRSTDEQEEIES